LFVPALPAAATNRTPALTLFWIAFSSDDDAPLPPQLSFQHADVDAAGFHVDGVVDGGDGGRGAARAVGAEELEPHQPAAPAHAGHADAVVPFRRDRAGDVSPVTVVVQRCVVVVEEVPAVDVVDVPVPSLSTPSPAVSKGFTQTLPSRSWCV
jgi:hypothetical protein